MNLMQILSVIVSCAGLLLAAISLLALVFKGGRLVESLQNTNKVTEALWHAVNQKVDEKLCAVKGAQLLESVENLNKATAALWHAVEQKVDEKVCEAKHTDRGVRDAQATAPDPP